MSKRLSCLAAVLAVAVAPRPSRRSRAPRAATASDSVGGKKVAVDYGRPALKGRTLDELLTKLPADRMWRAGENQVTTLTTDGDVMIGGKKVPAGKYSRLRPRPARATGRSCSTPTWASPLGKICAAAPDEHEERAVAAPRRTTRRTIGGQEVARVPLKAVKAAAPADLFTISFAPSGARSTMTLAWGDQAWTDRSVSSRTRRSLRCRAGDE